MRGHRVQQAQRGRQSTRRARAQPHGRWQHTSFSACSDTEPVQRRPLLGGALRGKHAHVRARREHAPSFFPDLTGRQGTHRSRARSRFGTGARPSGIPGEP